MPEPAANIEPAPHLSRRRPVRWIALGVGAAVLVLAVVLAAVLKVDPQADAQRSQLVGTTAPSFDLPTLDNGRVRAADLAGKVVVINFWNTWCIPCRQEHPALVDFYQRHVNDPDFMMIGIVRDDTTAAVRAYVRAQHVGWTVALDPGSAAALDFATRGQPETYVISPEPGGTIVASKWGPSTVNDLETMLADARGQR